MNKEEQVIHHVVEAASYTAGFEAGKKSGADIALDVVFHYFQNEGLETWLTSYKDGNVEALKHVYGYTLHQILKERVQRLIKGWTPSLEESYQSAQTILKCHAGRDGDRTWEECPQIKDGEPLITGRHCPLDVHKDNEE